MIDAANVIGSRPDGWWRDRPAAARRLAGRLSTALADPAELARRLDLPAERIVVHLVLEGAARAAAADIATAPDLVVALAVADGDSTIAALSARHPGAVVVTADRALRVRVQATGATVLGPRTLLAALPE